MAEANGGLFRTLNERIRTLATSYRGFDDTEIPFVCECTSNACFVPVVLSLVEYDELCAAGGYVLAIGHAAGTAAAARAC